MTAQPSISTRLFFCCVALLLARSANAQTPLSDPVSLRADTLYRAGKYAEAADAYAVVTREHPNAGLAWFRLGVSLQSIGGARRTAAADAYRKALALKAGPVAMYNLASLHAVMGAKDSAFYWLDQSVTSGFTNVGALDADTDMDAIRTDARYAAVVAKMRASMTPCMSQPESRMFDFWVGDWDVVNTANLPAGKSTVQLLLGGCALLENWTAGNGSEGKSLNSYNSILKTWQQFWTDQSGNVTEYRQGDFINGSLRYTAKTVLPKGPATVHMTFTPVNKDTVRQWGEASFDDGKTWTITFDLYYHRRSSKL